jgi:hypothetical protein
MWFLQRERPELAIGSESKGKSEHFLIPLNFLCKYSRNKKGLSRKQKALLPFSSREYGCFY